MKLLLENWEKYLDEDQDRRNAFAQDVEEHPDWNPYYNQEFGSDIDDTEAYGTMRKTGDLIKDLYAKHADHNFLNSLVTIHWTRNRAEALWLLENGSSDRVELSAAATLPGEMMKQSIYNRHSSAIGFVIKGKINLLANDMDNVKSGAGRKYRKIDQETTDSRRKGVGVTASAEHYRIWSILVFDKEDWDPEYGGKVWGGEDFIKNEALVSNWKITGIISPRVPTNSQSILVRGARLAGLDVPVMPFDNWGPGT